MYVILMNHVLLVFGYNIHRLKGLFLFVLRLYFFSATFIFMVHSPLPYFLAFLINADSSKPRQINV